MINPLQLQEQLVEMMVKASSAELGAKTLQQANLLAIELNDLLPVSFLKAQRRASRASRASATRHALPPPPLLTLIPCIARSCATRSMLWGDLMITANFVEQLAAVANKLAGFVDIIELFGES